MSQKLTQEQVQEFLTRGVDKVIPVEELREKLLSGKKLRVYLGIDPTSPVVHLGHAVVLWKLRELQDWGHEVILLIGDFTAMIGDPSGKTSMRVPLTPAQVKTNAATYKKQVSKILSFAGKNPAKFMFNSRWLKNLKAGQLIELASHFTVDQMLQRDMFQERRKNNQPIGLHEFLYPILVGIDCVELDVDVEVGGSDQLFNILAGRTLMQAVKQKSKVAFTCKLLEGTDGRKMSKSYHNVIGVTDEANDMYGKVMSLKDELMVQYFTLATDVSLPDIKNPRELKAKLAETVVARYHGAKAAKDAAAEFDRVHKNKEKPTDIPTAIVSSSRLLLVEILIQTKMASSKNGARRLIEQGGVKVGEEKIIDPARLIAVQNGLILQVGKRKFVQLKM